MLYKTTMHIQMNAYCSCLVLVISLTNQGYLRHLPPKLYCAGGKGLKPYYFDVRLKSFLQVAPCTLSQYHFLCIPLLGFYYAGIMWFVLTDSAYLTLQLFFLAFFQSCLKPFGIIYTTCFMQLDFCLRVFSVRLLVLLSHSICMMASRLQSYEMIPH